MNFLDFFVQRKVYLITLAKNDLCQVVFMVSSVTGIAKEKQTEKTPETNPTESNQVVVDDGGQGPSGRQDGASAEDDSKIYPGVAFWIALRTHECMLQKLENMFVNMFQSCGFTIYHCKVRKDDKYSSFEVALGAGFKLLPFHKRNDNYANLTSSISNMGKESLIG